MKITTRSKLDLNSSENFDGEVIVDFLTFYGNDDQYELPPIMPGLNDGDTLYFTYLEDSILLNMIVVDFLFTGRLKVSVQMYFEFLKKKIAKEREQIALLCKNDEQVLEIDGPVEVAGIFTK